MLLLALVAGRQAYAQPGPDGESTPAKVPRRGPRTPPAKPPEDEDPSESDGDERFEAPAPPIGLRSAAETATGAKKSRRAKAASDAESRDPDAPVRRTTLNRAELAGSRARMSRASERAMQTEDNDAAGLVTANNKSGQREWQATAAPADGPIAATGPRTYLAAQGYDEEPATAPEGPSLEEQIAELRARLDQLTVPKLDPAPVAGPTNVSTVPGSVFGPDAATASGKYLPDGLTFTSKDGNFKSHIGGVVQFDYIGFANPSPGITSVPGGAGIQTAVEFRRLRLRAEGTMYENIDWVSEVDLALFLQNTDQLSAATPAGGLRSFPTGTGVQGGNTINVIQPTTVFMTLKDLPLVGNLRVGNQQDGLGTEHIESARFLDFMERSPNMDIFYGPNNNGYAPGISVFNNTADKNAGLQLGIYKNNLYDSGYTFSIGDAWVYGGRGIWTPYYDEESKGRYLVHTGLGAEYRTFNTDLPASQAGENIRIRSRGDLRNAAATLDPNYLDTGNFFTTSQFLINPELIGQFGPWLFRTEYCASWFYNARPTQTSATSLGSVMFQGGYISVLYFFTGENRTYIRQSGVFGRTIPNENFSFSKRTWGAWQGGIRFDWQDLNSGKFVNGGNCQDMTFGLNWFLNPNARFQFNYVLSWLNNAPAVTFPGTVGALNGARFVGDGTINSFGGRMDFTF
jgi:phosphate-selective porin OprO/OprP